MADTYDMNTLLPPEELQNMAQLWGSPAFYTPDYIGNATADRAWYIHLFTGRVPSPEEFYYGLYIDSRGDTLAPELAPLYLSEKRIGYFALKTNGYTEGTYQYSVGINALANGAQLFNDATSAHASFLNVARNENSSLSWMLDWSFSASKAVTLITNASYAALRDHAASGVLVNDRPTWFMISESSNVVDAVGKTIMHPSINNRAEQRVSIARQGSWIDRLPIVMGTVGSIGSGSDLEFATGADSITNVVSPVSLRIKCNAV